MLPNYILVNTFDPSLVTQYGPYNNDNNIIIKTMSVVFFFFFLYKLKNYHNDKVNITLLTLLYSLWYGHYGTKDINGKY